MLGIRQVLWTLTCAAAMVFPSGASADAGAPGLNRNDLQPSDFGVDLVHFLTPEQAHELRGSAPRGVDLEEIVRVGSRAVKWVDVLQKDTPIVTREQLWRRVDRIGKEPTPDQPNLYNPDKIIASYDAALKGADSSIRKILQGSGNLPAQLPAGQALKEVMKSIRLISSAYSNASRWLTLYPYHWQLSDRYSDLRPWIRLDRDREAFQKDAAAWAALSKERKQAWIASVAKACWLAGASEGTCLESHHSLADSGDPQAARQWFDEVHAGGKKKYDSKFGITGKHPGHLEISSDATGNIQVGFLAYDMPAGFLEWIRQNIGPGWTFSAPGIGQKGASVDLKPTSQDQLGAVHLEFQPGATAHVNSVGGDTITMDSNQALWLELAQVTITHEFGHVIGFPDCYVEFWSESQESFVYYSLNPDDRMCALSGSSVDAHRVALLEAYGVVARP